MPIDLILLINLILVVDLMIWCLISIGLLLVVETDLIIVSYITQGDSLTDRQSVRQTVSQTDSKSV